MAKERVRGGGWETREGRASGRESEWQREEERGKEEKERGREKGKGKDFFIKP